MKDISPMTESSEAGAWMSKEDVKGFISQD